MSRIRLPISFHRFLLGWASVLGNGWRNCAAIHISIKKPLSAVQYYEDVIKITLLLDRWLRIQLLFCKAGRGRLHRALGHVVSTLLQKRSRRSYLCQCHYQHGTANNGKHLFTFDTDFWHFFGRSRQLATQLANTMNWFSISDRQPAQTLLVISLLLWTTELTILV